MRLRVFLAFAICLLSLSGCSRESSISENVNLRNNHSVVFVSRTPFKDPQAFADSIVNLSNPDSVIAHDTLTVTINDTIYLMGFLKYNADKIYRYAWTFKNPDSTIVSKNATQEMWVFTKTSDKGTNCPVAKSKLFCPLFIAVDGNNARDTAGKDQFIRVIDTPPYLTVPKDTLWTRAKSDITFPIVALDSFGTIKNIQIDLDASGKKKPKEWKVKTIEGTDSMLVTIPFDSAYIKSNGDQKIYVIVTDDDDNETLDSVNLHFNTPPTIELLDPKDDGRYGTDERFAFFYKAKDIDNPASLRYFIRVAKSRDNYGTPPVLTDNDLIAKNIKEKSYEPRAKKLNDSNVIVTLKDPKTILSGKLYWDVWVTDGYDTVYSAKIKEKDGTKRPWKFFYGNLKDTAGTFMGYVNYEGWSHHEGIRIVFQDSLGNRYYTHTSDNGQFSISVKSGTYDMLAMDTTGYGFKDTILTGLFVDVSSDKNLGNLILRDTADPVIVFSDIPSDTINTPDLTLNGKFYDHGSQVKSAVVTLDGDTLKLSSFSQNTWVVDLKKMEDGMHTFYIAAKDSAGRKSDSTITFYVDATSIHVTVNGQATSVQENSKAFQFVAQLSTTSIADSLIWESNAPNFKKVRHKIKNFTDTLRYSKASEIGNLESGKLYEMYTVTPSGVKSNIVRFGIFGKDPIIFFEKPSNDTVVTIDDRILFSVFFYPGEGESGTPSIKTIGEGCNRSFSSGVKIQEDESIHWSKPGDKQVIVYFEKNGKKTSDTLRVKVIEDPPTVKILNKQNNTKKKIKTTETVDIKAFDKFGTVKEVKWTCSNNPITFDNDVNITESDTVTAQITFTMPGTATSNYMCVIRATDDDGEIGYDTITYNVIEDKPYLLLDTHNATVKINTKVSLNGIAIDTLGQIVDYMFYCDSVKSHFANISVNDWTHMSKLDTSISVPSVPCTWICLVHVVDDDSLVAADSATYTVVLDPPWVQVSEDYKSVTIKDTVSLDARSGDGMGRIVKYEWGCAPKGSAISYTWSSKSTPRHDAIMPASAETDFRCVVRVTDDDGLTATDTTHIDVALAPPTVTVKHKEITTRPKYKINLDADAKDADNYEGEIVKREWSCGEPYEIPNNWKKVSSFDTSWKAPNNAVATYICVARATDDDGNTATDTTRVKFTTSTPIIQVNVPIIHVNLGDVFDLNASINDAWQGVNWYSWQCFDTKGHAMEGEKKWAYHGDLYDIRTDTTSYIKDPTKLNGIDSLLCIVSAEESSSDMVLKDTTIVKIMRQYPKGVISAADTVYLWSGDNTADNDAKYFYTAEWGGAHSEPGELADPNGNFEYRWQFSNVSTAFYVGKKDGSLDTSSYEFNNAFRRPTSEGSMTISLDFRDSVPTGAATQAFYTRHSGPIQTRTVYFRKAWKNLAPSGDTVIATSNIAVEPALTTLNGKPYVAYLKSATSVQTAYLNGSSWKNLGGAVSASATISKIQLASNGSTVYMGVLTTDKKLAIYSSSGTSAWTPLGSALSADTSSFSLLAKSSSPFVLFLNETSKKPYFATYSNSWSTTRISEKPCRNITGAIRGNGGWVAAYVDTSKNYSGFYAMYDNSNTNKALDKSIADSINMIHLSIDQDNDSVYLALLSRKVEKYGPFVYKGTINSNSINWKKDGLYGKPMAERFAYRIHVAAKSGQMYVIFDDADRHSAAQSHVYQKGGSTWKLFGENELPYFKIEFFNKNGYYLRGSHPNIVIDDSGDVYISMLAWENGNGGGNNFGPIVMKYAAKNWTVNE
jgi:uncharacterized membrane protein